MFYIVKMSILTILIGIPVSLFVEINKLILKFI